MRMTGIDLIVLAPWIGLGVVLVVICLLLLRSRHREAKSSRTSADPVAITQELPIGPHWRALLEARWQARVREVTELSPDYRGRGPAAPAAR